MKKSIATAPHRQPISELPYEITQCCLPLNTGERAPPSPASLARQAETQFTYPEGIKGRVDLVVRFITTWFTCPHAESHQKKKPGLDNRKKMDGHGKRRYGSKDVKCSVQQAVVLV